MQLTFAIDVDKDSFFVGGHPGHRIGIHVDHPWSECAKEYGAPYKVYLHWWPPKKCLSFRIPFINNDKHPYNQPEFWNKGNSVEVRRRCAFVGCFEEPVAIAHMDVRLSFRNGVKRDEGSKGGGVCATHVDQFSLSNIKLIGVAHDEPTDA